MKIDIKNQKEAEDIILALNSGKYFCECPCGCGDDINLKNANLFYDTNFTPEGLSAKDLANKIIKIEQNKLKSKRTYRAGNTKSVNAGFLLEKMITKMDDFINLGYKHEDCRSLFNPIDFMIFKGLSKEGKVNEIIFTEVKSGTARLNEHQKQIKDVIDRNRVLFDTYK
ncbi:MAG TPA: Holliday junction resolvase-like protein [Candidatus Paceibacterota bacterium]